MTVVEDTEPCFRRSTRASYLEDIGIKSKRSDRTEREAKKEAKREAKKERKLKKNGQKSKKKGRPKNLEYKPALNKKQKVREARREEIKEVVIEEEPRTPCEFKVPPDGLANSRYTPDSLPLDIRNALREKIKIVVQDLAKSVSGPFGEKAVRLQAQGYRVAGRILVRPNKSNGKNRFTVCGKLAEAAGMTEVNLKNTFHELKFGSLYFSLNKKCKWS